MAEDPRGLAALFTEDAAPPSSTRLFALQKDAGVMDRSGPVGLSVLRGRNHGSSTDHPRPFAIEPGMPRYSRSGTDEEELKQRHLDRTNAGPFGASVSGSPVLAPYRPWHASAPSPSPRLLRKVRPSITDASPVARRRRPEVKASQGDAFLDGGKRPEIATTAGTETLPSDSESSDLGFDLWDLGGDPDHGRRAISSYWSLKETDLFPQLLKEHGTDFEAIALELGTKTTTMVQNFYNRAQAHTANEWLALATMGNKRAAERRENSGRVSSRSGKSALEQGIVRAQLLDRDAEARGRMRKMDKELKMEMAPRSADVIDYGDGDGGQLRGSAQVIAGIPYVSSPPKLGSQQLKRPVEATAPVVDKYEIDDDMLLYRPGQIRGLSGLTESQKTDLERQLAILWRTCEDYPQGSLEQTATKEKINRFSIKVLRIALNQRDQEIYQQRLLAMQPTRASSPGPQQSSILSPSDRQGTSKQIERPDAQKEARRKPDMWKLIKELLRGRIRLSDGPFGDNRNDKGYDAVSQAQIWPPPKTGTATIPPEREAAGSFTRTTTTTASSVLEPNSAPLRRRNSPGLSTGAVVGTPLGVAAAGAAIGLAQTSTRIKNDRITAASTSLRAQHAGRHRKIVPSLTVSEDCSDEKAVMRLKLIAIQDGGRRPLKRKQLADPAHRAKMPRTMQRQSPLWHIGQGLSS